jgi:glucose dehydrogenase
LAKGDPARTNNAYVQSGNHVVMGPKGLPMFKPPWSELVALNMDTAEQLWRVPIGPASDAPRHPVVFVKPDPLMTDSVSVVVVCTAFIVPAVLVPVTAWAGLETAARTATTAAATAGENPRERRYPAKAEASRIQKSSLL